MARGRDCRPAFRTQISGLLLAQRRRVHQSCVPRSTKFSPLSSCFPTCPRFRRSCLGGMEFGAAAQLSNRHVHFRSTPEHPPTVNGPLDLRRELQQQTIVGLSCLCPASGPSTLLRSLPERD